MNWEEDNQGIQMTERNLPTEEQRLWLNVFVEKLESAGLSLRRDQGALTDETYQICYTAETRLYNLHGLIRFTLIDMAQARRAEDMLEELIIFVAESPGPEDKGLSIYFNIKGTTARIDEMSADKSVGKVSLPYVEGRDYDVYTVIDDLVKIVAKDFNSR